MNCLRCELTRARLQALAFAALGHSPEYIADRLSTKYGAQYVVEWLFKTAFIYRKPTMPPFDNVLVYKGFYDALH